MPLTVREIGVLRGSFFSQGRWLAGRCRPRRLAVPKFPVSVLAGQTFFAHETVKAADNAGVSEVARALPC